MDILLKYLILGGKYLTKITANSIIEAYNRSISLTNRLSNQYENSLCIINPYENILELYNTHLEDFSNRSEMQLAFISDKHKKEFESYLKEIECKDLAEFLNSQSAMNINRNSIDFNKNPEDYLKKKDKGAIVLQPCINCLPCGMHSSNEAILTPKINMYNISENYKDNLVKSVSEASGDRFQRESLDNDTLRDIGKAQKYIQETCNLIHKLNCHASRDLCKLEWDTAKSTEVFLGNKEALSRVTVEELEDRLLDLQREVEDNERILLENHTQFKLLEQKLSSEILKKKLFDDEIDSEISIKQSVEQFINLEENIKLKIETELLLNISQTEFDKLSKGLVNKMLKIVPPRKKSKNFIPLPFECKMKIDPDDIKDRSKILEVNKQAFDELESHLRVVKIIKKNEGKVNTLRDEFDEVLSRKLPEIKDNPGKTKGVNLRPLDFKHENLGFGYKQTNLNFVRTYSQGLLSKDLPRVHKGSTNDFGKSTFANAYSSIFSNKKEKKPKKEDQPRIPKWKFNPMNKKTDSDTNEKTPHIKESSVYNLLKREMVTIEDYGSHLAKVKKQKDQLMAAKARFENFKAFNEEEPKEEIIKEVVEDVSPIFKATENHKRNADYKGSRVLKKKWNCSFSDQLKCIKIESTDITKKPKSGSGLKVCKEKLSWMPKKEARIDIKFVPPPQIFNLNVGESNPTYNETDVLNSTEQNNEREPNSNETSRKKAPIKVSKSLSAVQKEIENIEKEISKSNIDISAGKSLMKISKFRSVLSSTEDIEPDKTQTDCSKTTKLNSVVDMLVQKSKENTVAKNVMSNINIKIVSPAKASDVKHGSSEDQEGIGKVIKNDRIVETIQKSQSLHQLPKRSEQIKFHLNKTRARGNKSIIDSIDEEIARISVATETKSLNSLNNKTVPVVPEVEIKKTETAKNETKFDKKIEVSRKVYVEPKHLKDDLKSMERIPKNVLNEEKLCVKEPEERIEALETKIKKETNFKMQDNQDKVVSCEKVNTEVKTEVVEPQQEKLTAESTKSPTETELVVTKVVDPKLNDVSQAENIPNLKYDVSKHKKNLSDDLRKIRKKSTEQRLQRDNDSPKEVNVALEMEKPKETEEQTRAQLENHLSAKENLTDKIKYLKRMKDRYNPKLVKPIITPKVPEKKEQVNVDGEESAQKVSVSAVTKNIDIIKEKKAKMMTSQIMQDKLKVLKPKSATTLSQNTSKPKIALPESKSKPSLQQQKMEVKGFVLVNYDQKEVELAMKKKKISIKKEKIKENKNKTVAPKLSEKIIYLGDGLNKMENLSAEQNVSKINAEGICNVQTKSNEAIELKVNVLGKKSERKFNAEAKNEVIESKTSVLKAEIQKEITEPRINVVKKNSERKCTVEAKKEKIESRINAVKTNSERKFNLQPKNEGVEPRINVVKTNSAKKCNLDTKPEVTVPRVNVSKTKSEKKFNLEVKKEVIEPKINVLKNNAERKCDLEGKNEVVESKQLKEKVNVEVKTLSQDLKIMEDIVEKECQSKNVINKLQVQSSKIDLGGHKLDTTSEDVLKHQIVDICVDSLKAHCERILKKKFQNSDINLETGTAINAKEKSEPPKKTSKPKASCSNYLFNNKLLEQTNSETPKNTRKINSRNKESNKDQKVSSDNVEMLNNTISNLKSKRIENLSNVQTLEYGRTVFPVKGDIKLKKYSSLSHNKNLFTGPESKKEESKSGHEIIHSLKGESKTSCTPVDSANPSSLKKGEDVLISAKPATSGNEVKLDSDSEKIKLSLAADCVQIKCYEHETGLNNYEINPFYGLIQDRKPDHTVDIENKTIKRKNRNKGNLESVHKQPSLANQEDLKYGKSKKGENLNNISNNNKSVHQFRNCDNHVGKNENICRRDYKSQKMKELDHMPIASELFKYSINDIYEESNMVFLDNEGLNKILMETLNNCSPLVGNWKNRFDFKTLGNTEQPKEYFFETALSKDTELNKTSVKPKQENELFSNLINFADKSKSKKFVREERTSVTPKLFKMKRLEKFIEMKPRESKVHKVEDVSPLSCETIQEELLDGNVWFWESKENCMKPFRINKKLEPIKEEINKKTFHIRRIKSFLNNALAVTYLVEEQN